MFVLVGLADEVLVTTVLVVDPPPDVKALYWEQRPNPTDAAISTSEELQPDRRHGVTADCILA